MSATAVSSPSSRRRAAAAEVEVAPAAVGSGAQPGSAPKIPNHSSFQKSSHLFSISKPHGEWREAS